MNAPTVITGRKVLVGMVLFFATVLAVNGTFFFFAVKSWPGLVNEKAYENGLTYNRTLDNVEQQRALGWQSELELGLASQGQQITVIIVDRDMEPVQDLAVHIVFRRPVNDVEDIELALSETRPGKYAATTELTARGRWYIQISASQQGEVLYRSEHEVMVRP